MQVIRPVELGILTVVMLIGIFALIAELIEFEEIAKMVVVPSLILLIGISGYAMTKAYRYRREREGATV